MKSLRALKSMLPAGEFLIAPEASARYGADKWFASRAPDAVALPRSAASVALLLKHANRHGIPVTARGAGYGYVGGCVPIQGGIVLSLERMKRIKEISAGDFVGVAQPGVTTQRFQEEAEKQRLFYPPDPASRADCSIGGNIATNAGGPRCLKYGVTRDYVLGLEVVLADGQIVRLGGRTHKNKTGFDLARLFVGSEGMLGIVTEATLKLLPLPPYRAALAVGLDSMAQAAATIRAIFASGLLPRALEVADAFTLAAAQKRTGAKRLAGCQAHLMIEFDGQERSARHEAKTAVAVIRQLAPRFIERAYGEAQCEQIWSLRREFSYALRDTGLTKLNEDIVVPRGRLEELFAFTGALQKKHGIPVACFGHAGDGNIHVNLMIDEKEPGVEKRRDAALDNLFRKVLALGGVITGEHGIGLAKLPWWEMALSAESRLLHRVVKQALDPRGILNPGKFV
jgi:glycolate oxidase